MLFTPITDCPHGVTGYMHFYPIGQNCHMAIIKGEIVSHKSNQA